MGACEGGREEGGEVGLNKTVTHDSIINLDP